MINLLTINMKWMNDWMISHLLAKEDVQLCPFCTKHFLSKDFFAYNNKKNDR